MASPVDAGRQNSGFGGTSGADPWNVTYPGSIANGDLLLMAGRGHGAESITFSVPANWTSLYNNRTVDASDDVSFLYYKKADGTETGTLSVDLSSAMRGSVLMWRITGAADPSIQPPEVTEATGGTTANYDPPLIIPTGGSKDYLFIAIAHNDGETQVYSVAPSGYTNLTSANSGTTGSAGGNTVMGGASRQATTSSEDPGAFTVQAPVSAWTAWTVAIHPPGEAPSVPNLYLNKGNLRYV